MVSNRTLQRRAQQARNRNLIEQRKRANEQATRDLKAGKPATFTSSSGKKITISKTTPERAEQVRQTALKNVNAQIETITKGGRSNKNIQQLLTQKRLLTKQDISTTPEIQKYVTVGNITLTEQQVKNKAYKNAPYTQEIKDAFDEYNLTNPIQREVTKKTTRAKNLIEETAINRVIKKQEAQLKKEAEFQRKLQQLDPNTKKALTRLAFTDKKWTQQRENRYNYFKNKLDRLASLFYKDNNKRRSVQYVNSLASGVLTYIDPILFGKELGVGVSKRVWLGRLKKNYPYFAEEVDKQLKEARLTSLQAVKSALKRPETYLLPLIPAILKVARSAGKTGVKTPKGSKFKVKGKVKTSIKGKGKKVTVPKKVRELLRKEYKTSDLAKGIKRDTAKFKRLLKKVNVKKEVLNQAIKLEKARVKLSIKNKTSKVFRRKITPKKVLKRFTKEVKAQKRLELKRAKQLNKELARIARIDRKLTRTQAKKLVKRFDSLANSISKLRKNKLYAKSLDSKLRRIGSKFNVRFKSLSKKDIIKGFDRLATKLTKAKSKKLKLYNKQLKKIKVKRVRIKPIKSKLSKFQIKKGLNKVGKRGQLRRKNYKKQSLLESRAKALRKKVKKASPSKIKRIKLKGNYIKKINSELTKYVKGLKKARKLQQKAKVKAYRRKLRKTIIDYQTARIKAPVNILRQKIIKLLDRRIKKLDKQLKRQAVIDAKAYNLKIKGLKVPKPKPKKISVEVKNPKGSFKVVRDDSGTRVYQTEGVVRVRTSSGQVLLKKVKFKRAKLIKNSPVESKTKVSIRLNKAPTLKSLKTTVTSLIIGGALKPVSGIKIGSRRITKPKEGLKPRETTKPKQDTKIKEDLTQGQRRRTAQAQTIISALVQIPLVNQKYVISQRRLKVVKAKLPFKFKKKVSTKKTKKELIEFVLSVPAKYRPSLVAILYRITGYKIPKRLTGFEVRPIIIKR